MLDYSNMRNSEIVRHQYQNKKNLDIRKSFHEKYSTNKEGFYHWLLAHYNLRENSKILELGAGKGDFLEEKLEQLGENTEIVLSDLSENMVTFMKEKYFRRNIDIKMIDIQNIPYKNETFDVVIANSMLYHVPNIKLAISEVYRVLKKGGVFYAATYGENGFTKYINTTLKQMGIPISNTANIAFTLQNGKALLESYFHNIKQYNYEDSFCITNVEDLIDYICSMASMSELEPSHRQTMRSFYEKEKNKQGIIEIEKEYGFFKARK